MLFVFVFVVFLRFFVNFLKTYDVKFRDIATGKDLDDVIVKTSGDVCWGADATTVFYTTQACIGLIVETGLLALVLMVLTVVVLVFAAILVLVLVLVAVLVAVV